VHPSAECWRSGNPLRRGPRRDRPAARWSHGTRVPWHEGPVARRALRSLHCLPHDFVPALTIDGHAKTPPSDASLPLELTPLCAGGGRSRPTSSANGGSRYRSRAMLHGSIRVSTSRG
jgi:hypothetical protein